MLLLLTLTPYVLMENISVCGDVDVVCWQVGERRKWKRNGDFWMRSDTQAGWVDSASLCDHKIRLRREETREGEKSDINPPAGYSASVKKLDVRKSNGLELMY